MTIDPYDTDLDWIAEHVPNDDQPLDAPPDAEHADRLLRALRRSWAECEEIRDTFQKEINRLAKRRDDLMAAPANRLARIETALHDYGNAVRDRNGTKTLNLTAGTLRMRPGSTRIVIDDVDALSEWDTIRRLGGASPLTVIVQPEPPAPRVAKSDIAGYISSGVLRVAHYRSNRTAMINPVGDSAIIVAATGEIVPGIHQERGERTVAIDFGPFPTTTEENPR